MAISSESCFLSVSLVLLLLFGIPANAITQTTDSPKAAEVPNKIDFGLGFTIAPIDNKYSIGMNLGYNVRMKHIQLGIDLAGYERNSSDKYGYDLDKPGLSAYRTGLNGQYIINITDHISINPSVNAAYTRYMLGERNVDYVTAQTAQKSTAKESYFSLIPGANLRYQFDMIALIFSAGYQKLYGRSFSSDFSARTTNEGWIYTISVEIDLND